MLLGIALLAGVLAIGAVACDDDEDDGDGNGEPTATEAADGGEPTEPADGGEPTEAGASGDFTTLVVTDGIVTTFDGYTVYTFDDDEAGISNCIEACAQTWPPLPASGEPTGGEGVAVTLATIDRPDGTTQVSYNDQPLYLYSGDANPGDQNGDGLNGVWHVVTP